MKPPCEIVVWYVIPSIRSKLAKELLSQGMKQKKISELLDITQPAVSQYISDKRGHELDFNEEVEETIKKLANDMVTGSTKPNELIPRLCGICQMIKTDEIICQLHKEKVDLPEDCNFCLANDNKGCIN